MKLKSYKDLEVWKRSITLVREIYVITKKLPKHEQYGLSSQGQRAAVSIPSNIAEGYARQGTGEYLRFLSIAYGSAAELETQLTIVSQEYGHIELERAYSLLDEVQRMLYVLMQNLKG